jgi:hypothetical protein
MRNGVVTGIVLAVAAAAQGQSVSLTQSLDPVTITPGNTAACANQGPPQRTTENSYYRSFDLSQAGLSGDLFVSSVEFAVENATHPNLTQPVTVRIYTDSNGGAPLLNDLVLVAQETMNIDDQQGTIIDFPINATVPQTAVMVVEIFSEDWTSQFPTQTAVFFPGSNPFGETAPTYVYAASCGDPNIVTAASVGFPGMHLIMTVKGDTGVGCYPDCDGSGGLDLFDFLCFVNEFNSGNTYADCDGSGGLDLFDFLCFVNAFNAGC